MDSFFSLFDPSEGNQNKQNNKKRYKEPDVVKKKMEVPKGRRRGRRSNGKNETLPEESSFLCEPHLSTEILVKDVSYIENFIEVNKKDDDLKNEDKKPRRRNSNRKSRRRRHKVSPCSGTAPAAGWTEDQDVSWNNQATVAKVCDESIGKNVNDLSKEFKNEDGDLDIDVQEYKSNDFKRTEEYNVIDKLEKVILKDDMYLAGDFNTGDLENDIFYSSDDMEEYIDESTTEPDDSGDEVYGSLPPEPRFGNVEYKLQLVSVCERKFQHLVTQLPDPKQSVELRVAVMGANEAGKSTIIGVLTQGELDNGRGSARLNMFRHLHEVKSGRTSSLSHEILGFDAQGNVVNYGCSELMTAERIGERSAKLVSFLDLAGHSKYQRTTLHGLTGYSPHYAMLVISATAGITSITEEHVGLLTALDLPFFTVISKCELVHAASRALLARLHALLAPAGKKPLLITDENLARNCVAPHKLILDTIDDAKDKDEGNSEIIPVFPVSCVKGFGLSALHAYLLALTPPQPAPAQRLDDETVEFQIDEIFHVGDNCGPVVGGLLVKGQLCEGDSVIIGPLEDGSFAESRVRSIYRNRVCCGAVRAGQCASVGLVGGAARPGMVLLNAPRAPPGPRPSFGGCPPGACPARDKITELIRTTEQNLSDKTKHRKNVRRKNKNLLQDLATVERGLAKSSDDDEERNIWGGPEEDTGECVCSDKLMLEDPDDPRGCIYFQASVQVLQHSTAIYPGFQCTVHVGNVRQTAIIEGIMSRNNVLRADETASVLFRFVRCPEYLVRSRRLIFTAGLGTRGIGRITQVFPYLP